MTLGASCGRTSSVLPGKLPLPCDSPRAALPRPLGPRPPESGRLNSPLESCADGTTPARVTASDASPPRPSPRARPRAAEPPPRGHGRSPLTRLPRPLGAARGQRLRSAAPLSVRVLKHSSSNNHHHSNDGQQRRRPTSSSRLSDDPQPPEPQQQQQRLLPLAYLKVLTLVSRSGAGSHRREPRLRERLRAPLLRPLCGRRREVHDARPRARPEPLPRRQPRLQPEPLLRRRLRGEGAWPGTFAPTHTNAVHARNSCTPHPTARRT